MKTRKHHSAINITRTARERNMPLGTPQKVLHPSFSLTIAHYTLLPTGQGSITAVKSFPTTSGRRQHTLGNTAANRLFIDDPKHLNIVNYNYILSPTQKFSRKYEMKKQEPGQNSLFICNRWRKKEPQNGRSLVILFTGAMLLSNDPRLHVNAGTTEIFALLLWPQSRRSKTSAQFRSKQVCCLIFLTHLSHHA